MHTQTHAERKDKGATTIRAEDDKSAAQAQQREREALETFRKDLLRLQSSLEIQLDKVNEDLARVDTKLEALKRS